MPIIDNTYIVSLYTGGDIEKKVDDLTNLHVFSDERNICNEEFIKMMSNKNIYEHTKEPYDDKYETEVVVGTVAKDENNREYIPVTVKVYKKGEATSYDVTQNIYKTPKPSTSSATSKDMKDLTKKVDDLTTLNEFADKRNICNDEFIKMLSSGNIYEHTKEPYDDKYDTEVITEEQDIDDNGRSFIPVTIKVYKKGDKVAYTRKENVYPVTIFDNDEKVGIILKNDKYKMMDIYPTSGPQTTKYDTMLEPPDKFNTKKLTTMYQMFDGCEKMTKVDVSNFNTSNVTDMNYMFRYCESLTTLDVSNFNTSNVTDMNGMFYYCESLTTLDVSNFNTSNVTDMHWMFYNCSSLTSLDVSKWDTSNVANMSRMFLDCQSLTTITGIIDMKSCTNYIDMFYNCDKLTGVKLKNVPSGFNALNAGLKAGQYTIVS